MSNSFRKFKCAHCHCGLEGPLNAQSKDRIACPRCGEGDSLENVLGEISQHVMEQMAQRINKALVNSKHLQVNPKFMPQTRHRFVVDLESG